MCNIIFLDIVLGNLQCEDIFSLLFLEWWRKSYCIFLFISYSRRSIPVLVYSKIFLAFRILICVFWYAVPIYANTSLFQQVIFYRFKDGGTSYFQDYLLFFTPMEALLLWSRWIKSSIPFIGNERKET